MSQDKSGTTITETLIAFGILIYNFTLVAGTAYLVALHDWSMWTFALTYCFMLTLRSRSEKDE
jgi:hypothetical protein